MLVAALPTVMVSVAVRFSLVLVHGRAVSVSRPSDSCAAVSQSFDVPS